MLSVTGPFLKWSPVHRGHLLWGNTIILQNKQPCLEEQQLCPLDLKHLSSTKSRPNMLGFDSELSRKSLCLTLLMLTVTCSCYKQPDYCDYQLSFNNKKFSHTDFLYCKIYLGKYQWVLLRNTSHVLPESTSFDSEDYAPCQNLQLKE